MVLGNGLVVVNQIIERPRHLIGWIVLSYVSAISIDTIGCIGNTQAIILEFRTKLNAILQTLQWLPHLAKVKLGICAAIDSEIGTLVGIILQFINRIDDVHIVIPRITYIVAVRIVRNCPWNHGVQCIIIITRSRYRLREVITIVLGTV